MTSQAAKHRAKRWLRLIAQFLSLILFGFLLWQGGLDAWGHIMSGNLKGILLAFLLLGLATMLAAMRLKLISCAVMGRDFAPWRLFYYLNMTTRVAGLVVPRGLSTFAGKPVGLHSLGMPVKAAVWTVLIDNVFDLLLLVTWLAPGLFFLQGNMPILGAVALTVGSTLLLTGGVWWASATGRLLPLVDRLKSIPWITSALPFDLRNVEELLPTRRVASQVLGLTVLINGLLAIRYHYIARAVGLTHPWLVFVAGFPITQLSLVLAVTPGGLGILEAGWYGVLLLGGVSHQEAIRFVIGQRVYVSIFVLIWGVISVLLSLTVKDRGYG